jgi:hypothetical protein
MTSGNHFSTRRRTPFHKVRRRDALAVAAHTDPVMRLVLSPLEPGLYRIRAGGTGVGHAVAGYRGWRAYLWASAGEGSGGYAGQMTALRLGELRAALGKRLSESGPWWT